MTECRTGGECGLPAVREWQLTSEEWVPVCDGHLPMVLIAGVRHREIEDDPALCRPHR